MFLTSKNNLKKYKSVFFADNNRVLALVLGVVFFCFINAVTVLLVWILFLTLLIAVHFQSMPSIFMTVVASLVLLLSYLGLMDKTRGNLGK